MKIRDRKHLVLRILQFSPLIPLIFNGIVWISVPGPLRGQVLAMRSYERMQPTSEIMVDDTMIAEMSRTYFVTQGGAGSVDPAEDPSQKLYWIGERMVMGTGGDGAPLYAADGTPKPFAWPLDDQMFTQIAQTDAEGEADLYAFALTNGGLPPLVAKAERAPALRFTPDEALLAMLPPEYTWAKEFPDDYSLPATPAVDPTMMDEPWKIGWYLEARGYGDRAPFRDSILSGGGGSGDDKRMVTLMGRSTDEQLYAILCITQQPSDETAYEPSQDPMSDAVMSNLDPTAPDVARTLDDLAQKYDANIYLLGPIEMGCIPLWSAPENADTATALAKELTAGRLARLMQSGSAAPPESIAAVLGTGVGLACATTNGYAAGSGMRDDSSWVETPAPTVLIVATSSRLGQVAGMMLPEQGPLGETLLDVRVWLAMNMHWLLNTGIGLLGLTLVLSPSAFIYERNLVARQRLVEEMERVQRDAHDKVYNRLSALSKRVELTSESISAEVARSLGGVAADIRETVADLQDILGDTRRQTAEMVGIDPLRSQLEHVCRAQAARLGVTVAFEAPDALPVLASQLGWDLQCALEEAITNAARHGNADTVRVTIDVTASALELAIRDNGTGSKATDIDALPTSSTGLRGMRERLRAHGGSLLIDAAGDGTTLLASVPLSTAVDGATEQD